MSWESWAKMPCTWQINKAIHQEIRCGTRGFDFFGRNRLPPPGEAIAALKIYIAFCLKANFNNRIPLPGTGCVRLSISELCELVGVSRPMAIKGLDKLQKWKIIETHGGRPAIYQITDYDTSSYWAKLPKTYLFPKAKDGIKSLKSMSNRSPITLHALQMYLYLAAIRNRKTHLAQVTYEHLSEVLGITKNDISHAISLLINLNLISVRLAGPNEFYGTRPHNIYWLRGTQIENRGTVVENHVN